LGGQALTKKSLKPNSEKRTDKSLSKKGIDSRGGQHPGRMQIGGLMKVRILQKERMPRGIQKAAVPPKKRKDRKGIVRSKVDQRRLLRTAVGRQEGAGRGMSRNQLGGEEREKLGKKLSGGLTAQEKTNKGGLNDAPKK